jgi:carbonic anhydrase
LFALQHTPEMALQRLIDGNRRFISNRTTHPDQTAERRRNVVDLQEPFAIILGCSDSRVSPEIIFDQGIGDLFVVRVAGNVVSPVVLESIEYSAIYLHSSVVLVMGHQNCGAVTAVLNGNTKDIETVAELIAPAIEESKTQPGDRLENAIKDNVKHYVAELRKCPALNKLIAAKKLTIVGGYYNFCTGRVDIFP